MTKSQLIVIVNALCFVHIFFPGIEQESAVLRCSGCESAACLIHGFAHCGFPIHRRVVTPVHCDVVLLLIHGCACKVVIL
jgi:hypothetical protein